MWDRRINFARRFLLPVLMVSLIGCTSVSTVNPTDLDRYNVSSGRVVGVEKLSGEKVLLEIDTINKESISGRDGNGASIEIASNDIKHIKVKHFSQWKTAGLSALALVSIPVLYFYSYFL